MESLVYEDSPLADYLEGEGEREQYWTPQDIDFDMGNEDAVPNFAPRGASSLQSRIRKQIPAPLVLPSLKDKGTLRKIHRTCLSAVSSHIGKHDNERFLEQFGYVIVASNLLDEYNASSHVSATKNTLSNAAGYEPLSFSTTVGLTGAVVTAATSFLIVGLIHWSRSRSSSGLNSKRVVILLIVLPLVGVVFYAFARRQWLKFVRHQAVQGASLFINHAQSFDSVVSSSVLFIQEVELVSRGYRISTPLPPISRLEETTQLRRCLRLRRTISECLVSMLARYVESQHNIRQLTDSANLEKYYDIYEISTEELTDASSAPLDCIVDDQYSLRFLRTLFSRLYTVRKSILCCLLALKAGGSGADIVSWTSAVEEMHTLSTATSNATNKIIDILNEQDRDIPPPSPLASASSTGRDTLRAQARRLNSLSQGIRALHAKMHVMREESDGNIPQEATEQDIGVSLMAQYESIGSDIRGLLQEWEAGKAALLNSLEQPGESERFSLASSDAKLPLSPTSSLGGLTAVDGSPTSALRALNGEIHSPSNTENLNEIEEILEAIVMPTSRKRQSLTREERIARVKEDRAQQAAARERVDASTNMLKELETVIKHRPQMKKSQRITSI
ncbi:Mysoin-binding motif of peroxisomes-domain-containing protein [Talaromyces proteolyticus]|uniref:Vezatin n=1 Tax=Talaromyces proteolyticus TaxID=1131652 RepID=A0AAD4Q2N7_9EURO|nr:Mysoin-binding motif of peroxisomes-domain-containing protein [Talaromyces proteolyticus]KAH8700581.1 Mysoin-binding motif of peroxisomes-domain-containing protein [Talaromyces proteolyticus]